MKRSRRDTCSNDVISAAATGTGSWPKGAAAVKELYASATAATPVGYAVYVKTDADSAGGGVVADGKDSAGAAMTICVGCHGGAGMDAMHTPSPGGRDQVYTPVHQ